jgi:hypothetical protein
MTKSRWTSVAYWRRCAYQCRLRGPSRSQTASPHLVSSGSPVDPWTGSVLSVLLGGRRKRKAVARNPWRGGLFYLTGRATSQRATTSSVARCLRRAKCRQ